MEREVGIIGAGVIGLACALELQKQGFKVSIYDPKGVANGASFGNAGHLATEQVFPLADPSLLLQLPRMLLDPLGPFSIRPAYLYRALPWFWRFLLSMRTSRRTANTQALKALNGAALRAYRPLLEHCNAEELVTYQGALLVFESPEKEKAQSLCDAYVQQGVSVHLLSGAQVRELEPALSDTISHALYFDQVGHSLNPHLLCHKMFATFLRHGGTFETTKIEHIATHKDKVLLNRGSHKLDKVVIAAGAWSRSLTSQLGFNVPLEAERGYHLMLPGAPCLSRPVMSAERKFIMTSMLDGLRLAGTVEFAGLDAPMQEKRAYVLQQHANALLPQVQGTKAGDAWMGCRPSLPDSLPVLGMSPNHKNIAFAFGHQHLGLTQAAISARLVTQSLVGTKTELDLSPFCISRFQKNLYRYPFLDFTSKKSRV